MTVAEGITLIAAVAAFIVSTAGAFVSVWNAVNGAKVHTLVNSQSARFEALAKQAGFAEGTRSDLKIARSVPSEEVPRAS